MYVIICLLPLPREIAERYLSGVRPESDELRIPTYERIRLFMQNKANLQESQMNVTKVLTKDYVNKPSWKVRKNKPNSKPNKANCRRNLEANSVFKSRKIRTTVIQPKRQISHKIAKMTIP